MASPPAHTFEVQRRTPRDEGVENMLVATVELLNEQRPEDVTVRDVAARSGHHHRFVQAWFGGKVGLFRAAFDRMSASMATEVSEDLRGDALNERALALARLLNWLIAADPDSMRGSRDTPLIDRVTQIYEDDLGLDHRIARPLAARAIGASISFLLFADVLGLDEQDLRTIAELDREMVEVFARHLRARSGD